VAVALPFVNQTLRQKNSKQPNNVNVITLSPSHYAEFRYAACRCAKCHYAARLCAVCYYAEWHYADCCNIECHYAECHYAEWHYAECHYPERHYASPLVKMTEFSTEKNISPLRFF
jgi:hypothetical protein